MGREFGLGWTAVSRENGVGVLAQAFKLSHAARGYPVAANEAERQAQIHQLDDRKKLVRFLFHLPQQVEKPLTAADFLVEGRDQRSRVPAAAASPWCVENHVVEAGTECVMCRAKLFERNAAVACPLLKGAYLARGSFTQVACLRRMAGVVESGEQLQQGR